MAREMHLLRHYFFQTNEGVVVLSNKQIKFYVISHGMCAKTFFLVKILGKREVKKQFKFL
jgi:hypothetical protein